MTEIEKLNACCFFLIKTCTDAGADRLKIDKDSVTLFEQPCGDWEIIVRKKDAKD